MLKNRINLYLYRIQSLGIWGKGVSWTMPEIMVTKLVPPRIENSIIERPRLLETLKQTATTRVVLLTAPAGYGKTVLITQYLSQTERPSFWYQLDPYDNDPTVFLDYLLTGIRQHYPDFTRKTLPMNI